MKPQGSTVLSLPTHVDPALKELNNTNLLKYAGVFSCVCVRARVCVHVTCSPVVDSGLMERKVKPRTKSSGT